MREQGNPTELWTISSKAILFGYVILLLYFSAAALSPWFILSILLYLCANIALQILNRTRLKLFVLLSSILIISLSAYYVEPLLIILLPLNLYELAAYYLHRNSITLVLMLTPLLILLRFSEFTRDILFTYGLVALLGFLFLRLLDTYTRRVTALREDLESKHEYINRLTKSLNDNQEYIRQSEYTFRLEERNRLSQEIHDKIGHSMTGALIQMEASKRLLQTDLTKSTELLQNAIQLSKDGIESIRLVLKNMKPPTEQLGINRLRLLVDEFAANHPISPKMTYEGNVDLIAPIHWKVILENTQEALTNVLKYSAATSLSIDIRVLRTLIRVEIADNGKGEPKIIKGLGIMGMEERAASVNGTIIVDGSRGFTVTTLIPRS